MKFVFLMILSVSISGLAQLVDSFDDGNFTSNPAWDGEINSWEITGASSGQNEFGSNTLRLKAPDDGSSSQYLSLQRSGSW
nr:hypothetical protein [Fodinibius sp.]